MKAAAMKAATAHATAGKSARAATVAACIGWDRSSQQQRNGRDRYCDYKRL